MKSNIHEAATLLHQKPNKTQQTTQCEHTNIFGSEYGHSESVNCRQQRFQHEGFVVATRV